MLVKNKALAWWNITKLVIFYILPHQFISRFSLYLSRIEEKRWKTFAIRLYKHLFDIDMSDYVRSDLKDYSSLNDFFTRELKPDARPLEQTPQCLISPCDGRIVAFGAIQKGTLLQAKNKNYTLSDLFGDVHDYTNQFKHGSFATIYLAPQNYHRVHMPTTGRLEAMIHIPGRLFSVAPYALSIIPRLYAKNERVISVFQTAQGMIAVVMVAAMNVGCIQTVWQGIVAPSSHQVSCINYTKQQAVYIERGMEMARFNLGSTVILLSANNDLQWAESCAESRLIQLGEKIATVNVSL